MSTSRQAIRARRKAAKDKRYRPQHSTRSIEKATASLKGGGAVKTGKKR